jgi:hypothetical protein
MHNNQVSFHAYALQQRYKSGARWFFWIAGLSVVTSILSLSGSDIAFFLSLGTTQVIDAFARGLATQLGDGTKFVALILDVVIAGVFAVIGWFALKRHLWSFVLGMTLFALDALILLVFQVWISFVFHALVIFWIFKGYQAGQSLVSLERDLQASPPPPPMDLTRPVPAVDGAQS